MYTKQEKIIQYYREGKSQRNINEELGVSRKTVKKILISVQSKLHDNPGQKTIIMPSGTHELNNYRNGQTNR